MRQLKSFGVATVLLLASGCTEDSSDPKDADSEAGSSSTASNGGDNAVPDDPSAPRVGLFTVLISPPEATDTGEGLAAFQGAVRDGPPLELTAWTVLEEDADCTLLEPSIPFCDPACGSGSACVPGDECQEHPQPKSIGSVTLTGLELESGESEFSLTPLKPNFNYLPGASVRLVYPPVAEGAEIQLASEGGDYSPVTIQAKGIAPLEVETTGDSIPISSDAPLILSWTPAGSDGDSKILIEMDISHHGGQKGQLECETADDGSLEISQSLVAGLIELGYAGFPTIRITRKSIGGANIEAGRVVFEIISDLELPLDIDGLVSCTEAGDCDSGQMCGTDRVCR